MLKLFFKVLNITSDASVQPSAEWEEITAEDLGPDSVGDGNKVLCDDMSWKTPSGGGSGLTQQQVEGMI